MTGTVNLSKILPGKSKRLPRRHRHGKKTNIETATSRNRGDGVEWINLARVLGPSEGGNRTVYLAVALVQSSH
jgi:hypothetical protein